MRIFYRTVFLYDGNGRYSKQGIIWALVEARIRDQLQEAAIVCVANQLLTDEQAKTYFHSSEHLHIPVIINMTLLHNWYTRVYNNNTCT